MTDTIDLKGIECIPVSGNCFKIRRNELLKSGQEEPIKDRIFNCLMSGFVYSAISYHKTLDYIYITLR